MPISKRSDDDVPLRLTTMVQTIHSINIDGMPCPFSPRQSEAVIALTLDKARPVVYRQEAGSSGSSPGHCEEKSTPSQQEIFPSSTGQLSSPTPPMANEKCLSYAARFRPPTQGSRIRHVSESYINSSAIPMGGIPVVMSMCSTFRCLNGSFLSVRLRMLARLVIATNRFCDLVSPGFERG